MRHVVDRTMGPARAALAARDLKRASGIFRTFNRILVLTGLAWTAFCIGSLAYHAVEARRHVELLARHEAGESISKDMLGEVVVLEGEPHYRLMRPLYVERTCLKCHAAQGYRLGDLRGGISTAIPMSGFATTARQHLAAEGLHFGSVWALGFAGVLLGAVYVRRHIDEREAATGALTRNLEFTRSIMETRAVPLRDDTGAVELALGITQDITARRQADEQRLKLESQLQQAQRLESVGRLAGGVAHDFNNKLQTILGCAHLALLEAPQQGSLREKIREIQKAADLTRQLLTFARRQAGAPRPLDLNVPIEGMLTMLRRLIGESIDLSRTPGPGLWQVSMDPAPVDQILVNLCVNGRDAIAGAGRIAIETHNTTLDAAACAEHPGCIPGEYVLLRVGDDGVGIGEEAARHIFEPFFTTKGVGSGTGLGLAIVHGIVTQRGGFIEVSSASGRGTTFSIRVPRCAAADETAKLAGKGGGGLLETS